MSHPSTKPQTAHGGCLCEGVRYKITFDPDFDFSKGCSTCQCIQCRKNSGALAVPLRRIKNDKIEFTAQDTLRRYYATPGIARGFCSTCGGFLFWHCESEGHVSISIGTFDKEDLLKYGSLLAESHLNLWCAEEIPGVTDSLPGEKWKYESEGDGAERM